MSAVQTVGHFEGGGRAICKGDGVDIYAILGIGLFNRNDTITGIALFTLRALSACCTGVTLVTLRALSAGVTLVTLRALSAGVTLLTLNALDTLFTLRTGCGITGCQAKNRHEHHYHTKEHGDDRGQSLVSYVGHNM